MVGSLPAGSRRNGRRFLSLEEKVMDTDLIYLFYTLVLASMTALIWIFIRQGKDANEPQNGYSHVKHNHTIEDNGDE
jgi:hypothetical protein